MFNIKGWLIHIKTLSLSLLDKRYEVADKMELFFWPTNNKHATTTFHNAIITTLICCLVEHIHDDLTGERMEKGSLRNIIKVDCAQNTLRSLRLIDITMEVVVAGALGSQPQMK